MAKRITIVDMKCPFCEEYVQYWPNCSSSTCRDYGNVGWLLTRRGRKQFFYNSCFHNNTNTIGALRGITTVKK